MSGPRLLLLTTYSGLELWASSDIEALLADATMFIYGVTTPTERLSEAANLSDHESVPNDVPGATPGGAK
jgi:hypothetical protein